MSKMSMVLAVLLAACTPPPPTGVTAPMGADRVELVAPSGTDLAAALITALASAGYTVSPPAAPNVVQATGLEIPEGGVVARATFVITDTIAVGRAEWTPNQQSKIMQGAINRGLTGRDIAVEYGWTRSVWGRSGSHAFAAMVVVARGTGLAVKVR